MKVIFSVLAAVAIACSIAGCGPKTKISPNISMERQHKYGRLAIVCAPKKEANPVYAPMMLKETQSRISPLEFLEKVDCLFDVPVDTASTPPIVHLDNLTDYDAVVCLVYSYESGCVYLDFYMTDTTTGEQIWYHQFSAPDPAIKVRLLAQALFAPTAIKKHFYGL